MDYIKNFVKINGKQNKLNSVVSLVNDIDFFNGLFDKMEEFYTTIDENLIETFKRSGFGVIITKKENETVEFVIKQLSWNLISEQSIEIVKSIFEAFEPEINEISENFDTFVYCEKLNEDIFKVTVTDEDRTDIVKNDCSDNYIYYSCW